jgi:hypothetical protein
VWAGKKAFEEPTPACMDAGVFTPGVKIAGIPYLTTTEGMCIIMQCFIWLVNHSL